MAPVQTVRFSIASQHDGSLVATQTPSSGAINRASISDDGASVVLSVGARTLVLLGVEEGALVEVGRTDVEGEVACVHLGRAAGEQLCTVGTWDRSVLVLGVPSLRVLQTLSLGGDMVPRCVRRGRWRGCDAWGVFCGFGGPLAWARSRCCPRAISASYR